MPGELPGDVTQLLQDWKSGTPEAFDALVPVVYAELRRIALGLMRGERSDHTLQPTALLHELYFKLAQQRRVDIGDRSHFYTFAAKLMRMILVDHARAHHAQRRGGTAIRVPLTDDLSWLGQEESYIIDLNRAIAKLEQLDERRARILELRFCFGFTVDEIAELLNTSKATVDRDLKFVRAWLFRELNGSHRTQESVG
jgi:RNA polymerase sigma factor (TIGR02999 family)